jgi:hypothetical protein
MLTGRKISVLTWNQTLGGVGGNFRIILEPHQIFESNESQFIGDCLDDNI